jgi:hypothetical protein
MNNSAAHRRSPLPKAASSERGGIIRADRAAQNWEESYRIWKKSLETNRLPPQLATGGLVLG